jgi:L-asparagine transporter-like permease
MQIICVHLKIHKRREQEKKNTNIERYQYIFNYNLFLNFLYAILLSICFASWQLLN